MTLEKTPLPFVWVLGAGAAGLSLETWDVNSARGGGGRGEGCHPQGALGERNTGHECPQELLGSGIQVSADGVQTGPESAGWESPAHLGTCPFFSILSA